MRLALGLTVSILAAACSSPTAPTPRPTTPAPPVTPAPGDQRPVTIACPPAQTATSSDGREVPVSYPPPTVSGGASGADGVSLATASCTPASGSLFPVGTTQVRCSTSGMAETVSCTFPVTVTPPPPRLARTRFLAFGDSATAGEVAQPTAIRLHDGTPHFRLILIPSASYPSQLLTLMRARYTAQAAEIQITNSGRPGEWAADGATRLPGVLSTFRPDVVMLLEGLNDLVALGEPGVRSASRALDTMAKEARGRGARVFLATLPPTRPMASHVPPVSLVQALNAEIRATARGEGAVLVDVYQALNPEVARFIGADGMHPTEAGYQKIAETFFAAIRADLERDR